MVISAGLSGSSLCLLLEGKIFQTLVFGYHVKDPQQVCFSRIVWAHYDGVCVKWEFGMFKGKNIIDTDTSKMQVACNRSCMYKCVIEFVSARVV